jgi:hypothetical protein
MYAYASAKSSGTVATRVLGQSTMVADANHQKAIAINLAWLVIILPFFLLILGSFKLARRLRTR